MFLFQYIGERAAWSSIKGGTVTVILSLIAHIALSVGFGFLFGRRSDWSKRRVVMVSALPGAIILWGLGAVVLGIMVFAPTNICESDGCAGPITAVAVMAIFGLVAYAIGIVFALVGLQLARPKSRDGLHDVFK